MANATFNGVPLNSTCHFDFDVFRKGGELVLGMTSMDDEGNSEIGTLGVGCRGTVPESLSAGGFQ